MDRPLEGMRVVNIGVNIPAPVAASRLGELGAAVTKVEPPSGDALAMAAPEWFAALTEGQDVLILDLKQETGRAALLDLLASADLLLTSQRPAALKRMALDWEPLHARFPRLCYAAVVGYAKPREDLPGHDLTFMAAHGLLRPPHMPLTLVADLAGVERMVGAALALLLARERSGGAGYAEVPLDDAAAAFALPLKHGLTKPGAPLGGGLPAYGIYATRDGYVAVAALEGHFFKGLSEALHVPASSREELAAAFETRTAAEWEAWAKERDLPIAAIAPHVAP